MISLCTYVNWLWLRLRYFSLWRWNIFYILFNLLWERSMYYILYADSKDVGILLIRLLGYDIRIILLGDLNLGSYFNWIEVFEVYFEKYWIINCYLYILIFAYYNYNSYTYYFYKLFLLLNKTINILNIGYRYKIILILFSNFNFFFICYQHDSLILLKLNIWVIASELIWIYFYNFNLIILWTRVYSTRIK